VIEMQKKHTTDGWRVEAFPEDRWSGPRPVIVKRNGHMVADSQNASETPQAFDDMLVMSAGPELLEAGSLALSVLKDLVREHPELDCVETRLAQTKLSRAVEKAKPRDMLKRWRRLMKRAQR
jgi:hypothetical protein